MEKVKFFTNLAPHYREPLWRILLRNSAWEAHFFYGENRKAGVQSIDFEKDEFLPYKDRLHKVKNYWWKVDFLFWQKGVIAECCRERFHYAVFLGEMSRLHIWIAALICRMRGIRVAFWGHGFYGSENRLKLALKKAFFRLAHTHLLYERRARELMIRHGFSSGKLYVVFNSLDFDAHRLLRRKLRVWDKTAVFPFLRDPSLPVVIFIGRLTGVKKLDLLLQAANLINRGEPVINLVITGDGPERKKLEELGKTGLKNRWLYFTGACYDEEETGKFLFLSDLCVSPGNVGLTAIHSLSFGTPVCTHDNLANQMPEAGAIQQGENGFFFRENDVNDLATKMAEWLKTHTDREAVREKSYEIIDRYYNPRYQLTVFNRLISGQKPEL